MLSMKPHSYLFSIFFQRIVLLNCLNALVLFVATENSSAQEHAKRPTIGLVLSGGGARGIAHLGVIKVMEERALAWNGCMDN